MNQTGFKSRPRAAFVLIAAALLGIAPSASRGANNAANPPPVPAPAGRIGIMDLQEAIISTDDGKKGSEDLEKRFSQRHNELQQMDDAIRRLREQLQANETHDGEDVLRKKRKAIDAKQKEFDQQVKEFQDAIQKAEQEMFSRLGKKMMAVLDLYAKSHGYALILDVSDPKTPVLWAGRETLITNEIVAAYNAMPGPPPEQSPIPLKTQVSPPFSPVTAPASSVPTPSAENK